ncbi:unnamed protein product [Arabis nemorensis]|uniref:Aminotransferase class I/classII large domain-containing protein n=1 Tax=Arabis nemorensis TaxID=586526 RepID=A0A565C174_9BRAS|nr:unnamed protein product [Arabis nemorensis]
MRTPCGNVYSHDHLKKVAETARKQGIMVITNDQTIFGDNPFVPMGKFATIVPVLTLGGISKGWVVPGWKIGWIALSGSIHLDITPDPSTIIQNRPSSFEFTVRVFLISVSIPLPPLHHSIEKGDKKFFAKKNERLKHNVDLACGRLKDIPCLVCPKKPESCTYLLVKIL